MICLAGKLNPVCKNVPEEVGNIFGVAVRMTDIFSGKQHGHGLICHRKEKAMKSFDFMVMLSINYSKSNNCVVKPFDFAQMLQGQFAHYLKMDNGATYQAGSTDDDTEFIAEKMCV